MQKLVYVFFLLLCSCSIDPESYLETLDEGRLTGTIEEVFVLSEVAALRDQLYGQQTKSFGNIEIVRLMPLTRSSSDVVPYVVNYPDNGGYAVMATCGSDLQMIAITSSGYLNPAILQEEIEAMTVIPAEPILDEDQVEFDSDDVLYGDEHITPFPMDDMPYVELGNGEGYILSRDHPAIGFIAGAFGEIGWTDDNVVTNPDNPPLPTGPIDPVDSSCLGVWTQVAGVRPLIQTKWGQSGVYQRSFPTVGDEKVLVGCGAVAAGQLIAALRPEDLSYDWNRLTRFGTLSNIQGEGKSEEDKVYVSDFLYFVAEGINTDYGVHGSSSWFRNTKWFLSYGVGIEGVKAHSNRDDAKFIQRIDGRLRLHLPVFMRGDRLRDGQKVGHAFLIDGFIAQRKYNTLYTYDYRKLHHINWGWDGVGDGYYNILNLAEARLIYDEEVDSVEETPVHDYVLKHKILTYKYPSWWN